MANKITLIQLAQKGKAVRTYQSDYFRLRRQVSSNPGNKELADAAAATLIKSKTAEKEFDQLIEEIALAGDDVELLPKNQFARLFNFPEGQLLTTIDDDDDDPDSYVLICKVIKDQTSVMTKAHFEQYGEAEFAMMSLTEARAREKFEGMYKLLAR